MEQVFTHSKTTMRYHMKEDVASLVAPFEVVDPISQNIDSETMQKCRISLM